MLDTVLEDLDYADDIALLSHSFHYIQEKTDSLNRHAWQVQCSSDIPKLRKTYNSHQPNMAIRVCIHYKTVYAHAYFLRFLIYYNIHYTKCYLRTLGK